MTDSQSVCIFFSLSLTDFRPSRARDDGDRTVKRVDAPDARRAASFREGERARPPSRNARWQRLGASQEERDSSVTRKHDADESD